MQNKSLKRRTISPETVLFALLLLVVTGHGLLPPIAQDPAYHNYADTRSFGGIPYFWNVVSNLPMLFIGLYGLWQCIRYWSHRNAGVVRWIPVILSAGIFITCFGSAYYHWTPSNDTLLWDRLPMTLMFMSLLALLAHDYLGYRVGIAVFWLAIPIGIISVLYWYFTEAAGHGDLRPYALVQFFPLLAAPVLILSFPGKVPYVRYFLLVLGWYMLAKVCERYDQPIYAALGFWSGHTLKHLFSAVGLIYVMKLLDRWFPAPAESQLT